MTAAHRVTDDAEALELAAELAREFAPQAAERDFTRRLPAAELDRLSASGLLGITVPKTYGGADVSIETLAEVFRLLSAADPNIGQIPHSHFVYVNLLREQATEEQRRFFFAELLDGKRFGNAQSEAGGRHARDYQTKLDPAGPDEFILTGEKFYCTGALFADWIPVLARRGDDEDNLHVAYVRRGTPGLTIIDDWAGMGQRVTASGTVRLDGVRVPAFHVVPRHLVFSRPQLYGAISQLLHAAIDAGIAAGALADAVEFVRTISRPWFESGVDSAAEEPLLLQRFGELSVLLRSAEAVLASAAREIDEARAEPHLTEEHAAEVSLAVAVAKVVSGDAAVKLADAIFEVGGSRASNDAHNLHRHWRNARTHTLHDPARWKIQHIGRFVLGGVRPPSNSLF